MDNGAVGVRGNVQRRGSWLFGVLKGGEVINLRAGGVGYGGVCMLFAVM